MSQADPPATLRPLMVTYSPHEGALQGLLLSPLPRQGGVETRWEHGQLGFRHRTEFEARLAHSLAEGGASVLVIDHAMRQRPSPPSS